MKKEEIITLQDNFFRYSESSFDLENNVYNLLFENTGNGENYFLSSLFVYTDSYSGHFGVRFVFNSNVTGELICSANSGEYDL